MIVEKIPYLKLALYKSIFLQESMNEGIRETNYQLYSDNKSKPLILCGTAIKDVKKPITHYYYINNDELLIQKRKKKSSQFTCHKFSDLENFKLIRGQIIVDDKIPKKPIYFLKLEFEFTSNDEFIFLISKDLDEFSLIEKKLSQIISK